MTTKQLNTINPRNFKEKIELLKKKEAASNANFSAAIRDAREIRQIAGAYDTAVLKTSASSAVTNGSFNKTYSVPELSYCQPSVKHNLAQQSTLSYSGSADGTNSVHHRPTNGHPHRRTGTTYALQPHHQHLPTSSAPSHANAQLTSLLSKPITSPNLNKASSVWSDSNIGQCMDLGRGNRVVQASHVNSTRPSVVPYTRAQTVCTMPSAILPSASCSLNRHTGDQTHWGTMGSSGPIPYGTAPLGMAYSQSNLSSDRFDAKLNVKSVSANFPPLQNHNYSQYVPTGAVNPHPDNDCANFRSPTLSYQAPASYYGAQKAVVSAAPSANTLQNTNSTVAYCPQNLNSGSVTVNPTSNSLLPPTSTVFSTDWRRVASDSSIRNSLHASSQTGSNNFLSHPNGHSQSPTSQLIPHPTTQLPHLNTARSHQTGRHCSGDDAHLAGVKKSDSLRRHFHTTGEYTSLLESDDTGKSQPVESDPMTGEHSLPAKRPFTSQHLHTPMTDRHYTGMHNLTLDDSKDSSTFNTEESYLSGPRRTPVAQPAPHVHFAQPCMETTYKLSNHSSSSAPNINFRSKELGVAGHPTVPESPSTATPCDTEVSGTRETGPPLVDLATCNAADLDHYLQIPSGILDSDDGTGWGGRRDSCTMAAEVLSALNGSHNGNSNTASTIGSGPRYELTSDFPKVTDVSGRYNNFLPSVPESHDEYVSNSESHAHTGFPNVCASSRFQDVADKLGISMSSNDYQLLTDPQLVNYVTDENTEAQLLR